MQGPDIRLYGSDGKRKTFPCVAVEAIKWELIERGFYGSCEVTIKADFKSTLGVAGNDRIEVYVSGTRRYRGYVSIADSKLDINEQRVITAYGLAERMNRILVTDRVIVQTSPTGCDVADIISQIVSRYIGPALPLNSYVTDINATGYTLTVPVFDGSNQSARTAMDSLMDMAAKRAVWGWDVDPATGKDRFFVRAKGSAVGYTFSAGRNVKVYSYPQDFSGIVNTVYLTGGNAPFPNMITNADFSDPVFGDAVSGNLITNSGFEDNDYWYFSADDHRVLNPNDTTLPQSRSGRYCYKLDNAGDYAQQYNRPVKANTAYTLDIWACAPNGQTVAIQVVPDVGTITIPNYVFAASPDWQRARITFTTPAGCTFCSVKLTGVTNSVDARIDDVALYATSAVSQTGWEFIPPANLLYGNPAPVINWAEIGGVADSKHGFRLNYRDNLPSGLYGRIVQRAEQAISVEAGTIYQLSAQVADWVVDTIVDMALFLLIEDRDGNTRYEVGTTRHVAYSTSFSSIAFSNDGWTAKSGDVSVRVGLVVLSSGAMNVRLDNMHFCKCDPSTLDAEWDYIPQYSPGNQFTAVFRTSDTAMQIASELPAAVKQSIVNYGIRESAESADKISHLADAINWAIGYFGVNAQPISVHALSVDNVTQDLKPDGLVRVLGSGVDPAFPVKIAYSLNSGGDVSAAVDLNTERPTFEGLLQRTLNRAKSVSSSL